MYFLYHFLPSGCSRQLFTCQPSSAAHAVRASSEKKSLNVSACVKSNCRKRLNQIVRTSWTYPVFMFFFNVVTSTTVFLFPLARNPYTDSTFLCGAVPSGLVLLLWYEPLQKFMHLKVSADMLHFQWLPYYVFLIFNNSAPSTHSSKHTSFSVKVPRLVLNWCCLNLTKLNWIENWGYIHQMQHQQGHWPVS